MKKCAIIYKNQYTGEEFWACSVGDHGTTYCLHPRKSEIPCNHHEASEFYGKHMLERAKKRIENDSKFHAWTGYLGSIKEYEREPEWFFELRYVLEHAYGDRSMSEVKKGFPLKPDVTYKICHGHSSPFVGDLELDELIRYYEWRKAHFKGKQRDV